MYQALYRKWRPKTFDEVVGQSHITETLKNQIITGRTSHAYLFIGTRGTGKTTCAKILAKALNCENPQNGSPCCKCAACRGIEDGSILDVVEIDAASNNGVENVRQLREEAIFAPAAVKKRVYIIDEVHMLSTAAFNALLKILEEPPEHLTFILATTELNKVPATILSRCQRHSFRRLDTQLIAEHLEHVAEREQLPLEKDAAWLIAGLAEGGMRDALSLLDQCSGAERIDTEAVYASTGLMGNRSTAKLLDFALRRNTDEALKLFNRLWGEGKDPATLLGELATLLRDCLVISVAPKTGAGLVSGRFGRELLESFCKRLTKAELIALLNTLEEHQRRLRDSKSAKLTAELCLISLCDPTLSDSVASLRARVARLEEDIKRRPAAEDGDDGFVSSLDEALLDEEPPKREPEPEDEPDELDPADFTEYQPEDDLLDKANPVRLNPDAAPEAEGAPQDSAELWRAIVERAEESLPPGICAILLNGMQIRGAVSYDTLRIEAAAGFVYNTLNNQDVLLRLRQAAQTVTGRSLKLALEPLVPEATDKPRRDIEELRRFKETRFI